MARSFPDFLGYVNVLREKVTFDEAKKIVKPLNLKSVNEWEIYTRSERFNISLPKAPYVYYCSEWKNWKDFLGKE